MVGLKLHKMKLFKVLDEPPGVALNPRIPICDQLEPNDEVFLATDVSQIQSELKGMASPMKSLISSNSPDCMSLSNSPPYMFFNYNYLSAPIPAKLNQELLQVKKEILNIREKLNENGDHPGKLLL